jgi:hypothetical protein
VDAIIPNLKDLMKPLSVKVLFLFCVAAFSMNALAQDDNPITPYRPSVSNPAQLPVPGQLELELGGLHNSQANDTPQRDSVPYLLKLGFSKEWGVLVGGEALVSTRDSDGNRVNGLGDTSLTLKRAFLIDDATAYGLEFDVKLPTAKDAIGSGSTDYTLNGIYSKDLTSQLHMDANLNFTRVGAIDPNTARIQTGWSSAFSLPLSERWGTVAELSGTYRSGTANTAQFLSAVTYSPTKRLTFDIGATKGLTDATPHWSAFTGVVLPLANLW